MNSLLEQLAQQVEGILTDIQTSLSLPDKQPEGSQPLDARSTEQQKQAYVNALLKVGACFLEMAEICTQHMGHSQKTIF
jgi:hypothetical protein